MATTQNPTNQEIVKKLQQILQEVSDLRGEIAKLAKTSWVTACAPWRLVVERNTTDG